MCPMLPIPYDKNALLKLVWWNTISIFIYWWQKRILNIYLVLVTKYGVKQP